MGTPKERVVHVGSNGDETIKTIWLRSKIKASKKPGLFIAQLLGIPDVVEPPTFYMDESTVRTPSKLGAGDVAEGTIQAILFEETEDTFAVQILGEAVSYGPDLMVPKTLAG